MPAAVPRLLALLAVTAAGLLLAFWPQFSTGFAAFTSDRYDGLIAVSIHEHWYNLFTGHAAAWNKVNYFHPWPNTLAMNDGYLLHGLLHAAFRGTGLPPLLSADLAGLVLRAITAPAAYLIARRHLGAPVPAALLGAFLAIAAGTLLNNTGHAQFFAIGPATLCGLLALEAGAALRASRTRHALATGIPAAILAGMLLLTSFYVTYVLLIFTALTLFWDLALRALARQPVLPAGRAWIVPLAVIGVVGILAFLPALLLYIPQIRSGGLHGMDAARTYAMTPAGLFHPGIQSPLWSWLRPGLAPTPDGAHGYGPLVLIAATLGTLTALRRALRRPDPNLPQATRAQAQARLVAGFGLVALGLALLITNWWGVWAWAHVWRVVPGMGAFRVTSRMSMLVAPAVMLIAAWWLATLRPRLGPVIPALLGLLLAAEQFTPPHAGTDRRAEEARLTAIGTPPADCQVFIATRPREGVVSGLIGGLYSHNVDAMMAASVLRLPTINGFSTFNPPGWDLADPNARRYPDRAMAEAARHNLTPCGLSFETLRWSPTGRPFEGVPPVPRTNLRLVPGQRVTVNPNTPFVTDALIEGWSVLEGTGVWSLGPEARLLLQLPPGMESGTLLLEGRGFARANPDQTVRPRLRSGPGAETRIAVQAGGTIEIPFTPADIEDGFLDVALEIARPEAPADPGRRGDHRPLGFFLRSFQLQ